MQHSKDSGHIWFGFLRKILRVVRFKAVPIQHSVPFQASEKNVKFSYRNCPLSVDINHGIGFESQFAYFH